MNLADLASRFPSVRWNASRDAFLTPCPRHPGVGGNPPSMAIATVASGRVKLECQEGCTADQILAFKADMSPPPNGAAPTSQSLSNGSHGALGAYSAPSPQPPASTDDILRRVPPQNLEAEQSVLGAILLKNESIKEILELIGVNDFYRESHRFIYRAMRALAQDNEAIDVVTLSAFLKDKDKLDAIGGYSYLAELAACVPTALNIVYYARIVREKSVLRQLAADAMQIATMAHEGGESTQLAALMNKAAQVGELGVTTLPTLIAPEIQVFSGAQLQERRQHATRQWVVDGLLAEKEVSIWSGKVEAGKTTLIRTLTMCVLRGEPFLERSVPRGRVLYAMLDADGEDLTYEEFERLGMEFKHDQIQFIIDPVLALRPQSFERFYQQIREFKPSLVVVDTLGRLEKTEDFSDYNTTYQMARLSELAKQTNSQIAAMHHIPRGRLDTADVATAAFGSIAIAGGANARFVCLKKPGGIYTLQSSKGKGGGFVPFEGEQTLNRDPGTGWITLAGPYSYRDQARGLMDAVEEVLKGADEPLGSSDLAKEIGARRSLVGTAANMLADASRCQRQGEGKKKSPYLYLVPKQRTFDS